MSELQTFGVSLPPTDIRELDIIAVGERVSRSVVVRWAVRDYLARRRNEKNLSSCPVNTTPDIQDEEAQP